MAAEFQAIVIAAVTAALAYVGNLLAKLIDGFLQNRAARKSSLIELQSYLLASRSAYKAQVNLRNSLVEELVTGQPEWKGKSHDEVLAGCFQTMSEPQKIRHGLIRSYTKSAIKPLNDSMVDWLKRDRDFKYKSDPLGIMLQKLEAHLVLWQAKYEFWIPDKPERALVYLADQENHGVGFPKGIEKVVVQRTSGGKVHLE